MLDILQRITKERFQNRVNRGLLPSGLGETAEGVYRELPKEYRNKLDTYAKKYPGHSVILTGKDSLLKDRIAACILLYYMAHYKTVHLYSTPEIPIKPYFATAFLRVDLLEQRDYKAFSRYVLSAVTRKRVILIGGSSLNELEQLLPDNVIGVLFSLKKVIEIEVGEISPEIIVI